MIGYATLMRQDKIKPVVGRYPVRTIGQAVVPPSEYQRIDLGDAIILKDALDAAIVILAKNPSEPCAGRLEMRRLDDIRARLQDVVSGRADSVYLSPTEIAILDETVRCAYEISPSEMPTQPAEAGFPVSLVITGILGLASIGISAYHGYKRNNSVGWAMWWGLMGLIFPVVTPAVAIAQGYAKRAR